MGTAKAGPPFVTDDPEVPPVGGWEINIPFTLNRTPGSTQMNAPLLDMNYGLPQLQIEFDIPLAVSSDDRKGTNAGLGDLLYGVKWRFFDDEKTQTQIGIYPQMFAPTGNNRKGLGGGRPNYILPLLAERSWGKWTLYGNVGYRLQTALGEQNYWYAGSVLQRDLTERLSLGVELFGNTPTVPPRYAPVSNRSPDPSPWFRPLRLPPAGLRRSAASRIVQPHSCAISPKSRLVNSG